MADKKRKEEEKMLKKAQKQLKEEEKARRRVGPSFKWSEKLGCLSWFPFFNTGNQQATNTNTKTPPSGVTSKSTLTESFGEPGELYLFIYFTCCFTNEFLLLRSYLEIDYLSFLHSNFG
jgi:hypothetical protein